MKYNYLCGGATKKFVLLHNTRSWCGTSLVPSLVPRYVPIEMAEFESRESGCKQMSQTIEIDDVSVHGFTTANHSRRKSRRRGLVLFVPINSSGALYTN